MLLIGIVLLGVAVFCGILAGASKSRMEVVWFLTCAVSAATGGHLLFFAGQKDAVGISAYDGDGYRISRSLEAGEVYRVVGRLSNPDDSTGTIVLLKDSTGEVRVYNFGTALLPDVFIVVENATMRYVPFPGKVP